MLITAETSTSLGSGLAARRGALVVATGRLRRDRCGGLDSLLGRAGCRGVAMVRSAGGRRGKGPWVGGARVAAGQHPFGRPWRLGQGCLSRRPARGSGSVGQIRRIGPRGGSGGSDRADGPGGGLGPAARLGWGRKGWGVGLRLGLRVAGEGDDPFRKPTPGYYPCQPQYTSSYPTGSQGRAHPPDLLQRAAQVAQDSGGAA